MNSIEEIYGIFAENPKISTDSREIIHGSIFFALRGNNFNGNKYAEDALMKGAKYAVIDEKQYQSSGKMLIVKDVLETLQDLAQCHRRKLGIPILGITGTNGKTTTKELTARVLSQKFNVSFTQGNLNNHIGVPLTLLSMDSKTEFGIVEMGANHIGEIAKLCSIADPDYGIITNVGKAHLEGFGSFNGVKTAKAELYDYIKNKNGTVFINGNNQILQELSEGIKKISYGSGECDFSGEPIKPSPFVRVKAEFPTGALCLDTNLTGDFNYENIMAAACIGNYFGVEPVKIQQAISDYRPSNIRSQLIDKNGVKIIMDTYNANPTSMKLSITSFLNSNNPPACSFLILGDMLELGMYSKQEHKDILNLLDDIPKENVFLTGKIFSEVASNKGWKTFENTEQLWNYLNNNPITTGYVLIKGSRGIQLERILDCF